MTNSTQSTSRIEQVIKVLKVTLPFEFVFKTFDGTFWSLCLGLFWGYIFLNVFIIFVWIVWTAAETFIGGVLWGIRTMLT